MIFKGFVKVFWCRIKNDQLRPSETLDLSVSTVKAAGINIFLLTMEKITMAVWQWWTHRELSPDSAEVLSVIQLVVLHNLTVLVHFHCSHQPHFQQQAAVLSENDLINSLYTVLHQMADRLKLVTSLFAIMFATTTVRWVYRLHRSQGVKK